jgi:hypothetical protein
MGVDHTLTRTTIKAKSLEPVQNADVTITGGIIEIRPLKNDEKAFLYFTYTWGDVPNTIPMSKFGFIDNRGNLSINFKIAAPGWVYIAICEEVSREKLYTLINDKWEETGFNFTYNATRKTSMHVYRKQLPIGDFQLERFHWSSPVVLLP